MLCWYLEQDLNVQLVTRFETMTRVCLSFGSCCGDAGGASDHLVNDFATVAAISFAPRRLCADTEPGRKFLHFSKDERHSFSNIDATGRMSMQS